MRKSIFQAKHFLGLWMTVFVNIALVVLTADPDQNLCYCHTLLCYKWSDIAATMGPKAAVSFAAFARTPAGVMSSAF